MSLGLKAGLDKKLVIIGALEEALMTRAWIRDKMMLKNKNKSADPSEIKTIVERAFYWSAKEKISDLDFWLNGPSVSFKINREKQVNLPQILKKLKPTGIALYFVEITSSIVKDFPIYVVKVVSPQLQPVYLDERYKYLGKERLFSSPKKMGYKARGEAGLNNIPHPFL